MSNIKKTVGNNIRLLRRARGMTQERLAEIVDVSGSYIGYLERGKRSPSLDLLAKIADVFKVDPAVLLTSSDDTTNRELKKLIAVLSDKGPGPIKFMNEVAHAYFKSLEDIHR
ncbi:MAG TPA: helix-turn-helix transcriptional regulator [Syntrophomonadaceae bacterium]|nr:helix-turn-helix transcriptional regulator [Syntrophomonadaceae bacterium]